MPRSAAAVAFRQRATSYVLRRLPGRREVEVLVILHRDAPEAGVQVPGGGALDHETLGQASVREAFEETGAAGLALGEVLGSRLFEPATPGERFRVNTVSWLTTTETRDGWDHVVGGTDDDEGMRFRCEFRPASSAGIDWDLDWLLDQAVERFTAQLALGVLDLTEQHSV